MDNGQILIILALCDRAFLLTVVSTLQCVEYGLSNNGKCMHWKKRKEQEFWIWRMKLPAVCFNCHLGGKYREGDT